MVVDQVSAMQLWVSKRHPYREKLDFVSHGFYSKTFRFYPSLVVVAVYSTGFELLRQLSQKDSLQQKISDIFAGWSQGNWFPDARLTDNLQSEISLNLILFL